MLQTVVYRNDKSSSRATKPIQRCWSPFL